jgi:hypothetical protein
MIRYTLVSSTLQLFSSIPVNERAIDLQYADPQSFTLHLVSSVVQLYRTYTLSLLYDNHVSSTFRQTSILLFGHKERANNMMKQLLRRTRLI